MNLEPTKNNVVSYENFYTLKMLKDNVTFMIQRNDEHRFDISIRKQKDLFRTILKESVQ